MRRREMPKELDYTMLSTFALCPLKYYFRMVRDLVSKIPPTAAEFGRCIHAALDEWYIGKDDDKANKVFTDMWNESIADSKRNRAVGLKVLSKYYDSYRDSRFEVIASELEFTVPIKGSDIVLIGRIDKLIDWSGAIMVMDHKTTTRLGFEFFNMIKPNAQFDGYIYAAQQLGYTCTSVLLDAILVAKGLLTPAQAAKLTPLARDISERSTEDIDRYLVNVCVLLEQLKRAYESDVWCASGAFNGACTYYGSCSYRRICKEDVTLRDSIIKMDYIEDKWSPHKKEKK